MHISGLSLVTSRMVRGKWASRKNLNFRGPSYLPTIGCPSQRKLNGNYGYFYFRKLDQVLASLESCESKQMKLKIARYTLKAFF